MRSAQPERTLLARTVATPVGSNRTMWWLAHGEQTCRHRRSGCRRTTGLDIDSVSPSVATSTSTRRWTTKQAIATVLDLDRSLDDLRRIEIRHRESGAPYVQLDGAPAGVDVSMSDRSGWAVCLVGPPGTTASGTVGIDLEVVEPRTPRFVADYFTVAERDYVRDLPVDDRDEAANLIWSAKEAALKVQQVGLRVDTRDRRGRSARRSASVDGWSAMTVTGRDGAMPGWWRRCGVFLLTIAFAEPADPPRSCPRSAISTAAVPRHSWVDSPALLTR